MSEPLIIEVLPSRLREVPAASLQEGDVIFRAEAFTALWVEKPDAQGIARVASAMGPSVRGVELRITERTAHAVTWHGRTADGEEIVKTSAIPEGEARLMILLPEKG